MGRKIKVFNGGRWITGSEQSSFEDADIVIMPGGGDWDPALYGQKPNSHVWSSGYADTYQMELINDSIKAGKIVFGICRGLQGVTIRNGGTLVQHIEHPGRHVAVFHDGDKLNTNSIHHQLCNPYNLKDEDYKVLAWTQQLSAVHLGEDDKQVDFPSHAYDKYGLLKEPEVIWYPKTRCIGAQSHPEMMREGEPFQAKMIHYINQLLEKNFIE